MNPQQAQEGLASVTTARRRTIELRTYRHGGSIVTAWGLLWLSGYLAQQFVPQIAPWVWLIGWAAALIWTLTRPRSDYDLQAFATWAVALAFMGLLAIVVKADIRITAMLFGLVLSVSYAVLGIWAGKRFAALAVLTLVSSCIGWWLVPQWLFLALAVGGGGTLLGGGLWLRRP